MRSKQSEPAAASGEKGAAKKKAKRNFEFSKMMALIAIVMWLIVNFFGMVIVVITLDASTLTYVIPSVDAVVAAVITFYLWKARTENQIKLRRIYGADAKVSVYDGGDDGWEDPSPPKHEAPLYENTNIV